MLAVHTGCPDKCCLQCMLCGELVWRQERRLQSWGAALLVSQALAMQFTFTCLSLPADTIPLTLPRPTHKPTLPCSATGCGSTAELSHSLHGPHRDWVPSALSHGLAPPLRVPGLCRGAWLSHSAAGLANLIITCDTLPCPLHDLHLLL